MTQPNPEAIETRNQTPRGRTLLAVWRRIDGQESYATAEETEASARPQTPGDEI